MSEENREEAVKENDEENSVEVDIDTSSEDSKETKGEETKTDEPDPIETADTEVQPEESKGEVEAKKDQPNKTKYQRRIDDLVAKQREAERQRDEYYSVAQKVLNENKELRKRANDFGKLGSAEMENRINSETEAAKIAYKKAYEEGDADKILEAQQKMIQAESARNQVGQIKRAADQMASEQEYNLAPPPNNKAVEWAGKNSWFNKDMVMTNAAYTIHDELLKSGVQVDSDDYYSKLDDRLRSEFPHKFSNAQAEKPRENTVVQQPMVTPTGGKVSNKSRKVRLTPSQVAVAQRLGVSLEDYAKEFVALNS